MFGLYIVVCLHLHGNQTHLHTLGLCGGKADCSWAGRSVGATGAQQGAGGRWVKGRPRRGENSRVRTYPCDKWYQSEVGSFWDGFRWISSLRSWGLRGTVASMVMLLGLRS